MRYRLECNFCREQFVHVGDGFPDNCPLCGAYVGLNGKPEVALPFLSSKANKAPDSMYRSMEEGAKHRAYMAAEMTGKPVCDFSGMLQTNMRDGLRAGDTSFVPVQLKDGMTASFGNNGQPGIDPNIVNGVRSGPEPNYGAQQINPTKEFHRQHAAAIVRSGEQNRHN
jgi:hypothetical protein